MSYAFVRITVTNSYAYYATLSHIGIKCSDSSSLAPFPQPALIEIMQEA